MDVCKSKIFGLLGYPQLADLYLNVCWYTKKSTDLYISHTSSVLAVRKSPAYLWGLGLWR